VLIGGCLTLPSYKGLSILARNETFIINRSQVMPFDPKYHLTYDATEVVLDDIEPEEIFIQEIEKIKPIMRTLTRR